MKKVLIIMCLAVFSCINCVGDVDNVCPLEPINQIKTKSQQDVLKDFLSHAKYVPKQQPYTLYKFWASWCGWCTKLSELIKQVKREQPNLFKPYNFLEINVDDPDNEALVLEYNVEGLPTLVIAKCDSNSCDFSFKPIIMVGYPSTKQKLIDFLLSPLQ